MNSSSISKGFTDFTFTLSIAFTLIIYQLSCPQSFLISLNSKMQVFVGSSFYIQPSVRAKNYLSEQICCKISSGQVIRTVIVEVVLGNMGVGMGLIRFMISKGLNTRSFSGALSNYCPFLSSSLALQVPSFFLMYSGYFFSMRDLRVTLTLRPLSCIKHGVLQRAHWGLFLRIPIKHYLQKV